MNICSKLLTLALLLALSVFGQQKPDPKPAEHVAAASTKSGGMTPLVDNEKIEMWTMLGDYQKIQSSMQTIQNQMNAIAQKYDARVKELQKAHGAASTCTLDQVMQWDCSAQAGAPKK